MKKKPGPATDWIAVGGVIGFRKTVYHLRGMSNDELTLLNMDIIDDKESWEEWKRKLHGEKKEQIERLVSLRKRQLREILKEFRRRKTEPSQMSKFFGDAASEMLDKETLRRLGERARELYNEELLSKAKLKQALINIPVHFANEEKMCGPKERRKVKHSSIESAEAQIEEMRERGMDVAGLNVYGPCPFCNFYHVGHKPKEWIWKRPPTQS